MKIVGRHIWKIRRRTDVTVFLKPVNATLIIHIITLIVLYESTVINNEGKCVPITGYINGISIGCSYTQR